MHSRITGNSAIVYFKFNQRTSQKIICKSMAHFFFFAGFPFNSIEERKEETKIKLNIISKALACETIRKANNFKPQ